ncbi:MAG: hypothetical protein HKP40_07145 [Litoreibacter sp.]|nr:hypothetical protein [Litoreibacter sp.]
MSGSFTKFKDRIWFAFDGGLRRLPDAPKPVQQLAYGVLRAIFVGAYYLPRAPLARGSAAFAKLLGRKDPAAMHRAFVGGFILGLQRMEMLRNGQTDTLEALLEIPEPDKLDALMAQGNGAVLAMPHCHASVAMVRGLAQRYPVLMLVRETAKPSRAAAQRSYYDHLGCECLDVRRTGDASVARAVLGALRQGKLVVGVVDRIQDAPPESAPYDKARDMVRAEAFGQPVGIAGWPARFAGKLGAPVLPGMVAQTEDAMILHLGSPLETRDLEATTQAMTRALEALVRAHPRDWLFVYDKYWTRVLQQGASAPSSKQA